MSVGNANFVQVDYHDPKRTLLLYECVEEDYLAVQEWLDRHLRGDYLFKRGHLKNIITRPTATLYAILLDGIYCGTVIVYAGSVLHNIMVAEEFRGLGIGEAVIRFLAPAVIRAKTNMVAGDPVPFYQRMGYQPVAQDAQRPHIVVMTPDGKVPDHGAPMAVPGEQHPRLAHPPESTPEQIDAAKWRALKERQRVRQARRKDRDKAEAASVAAAHLKPSLVPSASQNGSSMQYHHSE